MTHKGWRVVKPQLNQSITPQFVINLLITNCGACHHVICNNSAICNKLFKLGLSQDLLFVSLWFILRGDLFYVLTCVFCSCVFSVHLALRLPLLGKRELILVFFVRLFDLRLFGFVCFFFLLVSGKACGLWLWHSLNFSLTIFFCEVYVFVHS